MIFYFSRGFNECTLIYPNVGYSLKVENEFIKLKLCLYFSAVGQLGRKNRIK